MPSRQTALRTWSAHEPVGAIAFVTAMTVPSGVRTSGAFRRSSAVSKSNNVTAAELKALIETAGLGDAAFFKVRLQETE